VPSLLYQLKLCTHPLRLSPVAHTSRCPLEHLNLSKTNITDAGLYTLRQFAGATLRSLELDEVLDVTNEGLKLFFEPAGGDLQLGKVRNNNEN
jgi:hypothetical protein